MSLLLKKIQKGAKMLGIYLATETDSYRRIVGAIPQTTIDAHVQRVEEELHQLPASTTNAKMRTMFHTSDEDPSEHITLDGLDARGIITKTIHVAKDRRQQQKYR